jgi:gas vesicle protein
MSQQGNFVGGFLLGTLVGGALGGVVGALAASRIQSGQRARPLTKGGTNLAFGEFGETTEENMEAARLGLEAKIAQLNEAIDDVRQQLGGINGHADSPWEHSSRIDS